MSIPVITISREYGSGGRAIGERLAKELGIPFYDKELIFMAAKESGLSEEYIKKTEQMKSTSFLYGLYMGAQQLPMNDQIFLVQSKIIRQVASEGPCVIVGRCADYILRDHPRAVNVFVTGAPEDRVRRLCEQENVTPEEAEAQMERTDTRRASYYDYFSSGKWGEAATYHLCIDSSVLGIEGTADFIREFAERKLKMNLSGR